MNKTLLLLTITLISGINSSFLQDTPSNGKIFSGYFADWAHYRASPYKYTAQDIQPIASKLHSVLYGFVYFCPPSDVDQPYWVTSLGFCKGKQPYDLTLIDPKDKGYFSTIKGMGPKLVISVGGWNFPSKFYSKMVSTSANRQAFLNSYKSFKSQYQLDGFDIDWEYPCSQPRTDYVKITNTKFDKVTDQGGSCSNGAYKHGTCTGSCVDKANLVLFFSEARAMFPNDHLSIAASASMFMVDAAYDIQGLEKSLTYWNLMTYDYFVSDIASASKTAPNQNFQDPSNSTGLFQWGLDYTVSGYLKRGATASKMLLGIALYGHTWYAPGLSGDGWQKLGLTAQKQNACYGPFKDTYGAKPGKGCRMCGTYMYSEILEAGFTSYYDEKSGSTIGYAVSPKDSWTQDGTWISYSDEKAIAPMIQYTNQKGLAGAFVFDLTMDSISNGQFTYKMSNYIVEQLNA